MAQNSPQKNIRNKDKEKRAKDMDIEAFKAANDGMMPEEVSDVYCIYIVYMSICLCVCYHDLHTGNPPLL